MPKPKKGTGFQTRTRQWVDSDFRLVLRRDRGWPYSTRLVVIHDDGVETPLMEFKRNGTFKRLDDVYVRGIESDQGRIKEET